MNTTNKNKPLFTQKTLLIILSIFVSSCYKGGITRDIQNVSCVFNDSITQEEKKIDIRKYTLDEEIYDGNNIIVLSEISEGYIKYVDNMIDKTSRYIVYDTLGKILYNYSKLDNVTIGRSFRYDENGNIIKITNNDKEGELCAFQIMAIAKKYVGRNISKTPHWKIGKNIVNNRDMWFVYFTNRKGKAKVLVIDPVTGIVDKELRVVLALDCDPTYPTSL